MTLLFFYWFFFSYSCGDTCNNNTFFFFFLSISFVFFHLSFVFLFLVSILGSGYIYKNHILYQIKVKPELVRASIVHMHKKFKKNRWTVNDLEKRKKEKWKKVKKSKEKRKNSIYLWTNIHSSSHLISSRHFCLAMFYHKIKWVVRLVTELKVLARHLISFVCSQVLHNHVVPSLCVIFMLANLSRLFFFFFFFVLKFFALGNIFGKQYSAAGVELCVALYLFLHTHIGTWIEMLFWR